MDAVNVGNPGFHGGDNYVYLSLAVVFISNGISKVFKDSFLSQSYILVLFVCFAVLLICLLAILSRVCVMQTQTGEKPFWELKEPEVEDVKEEREGEPKSKFFRLLESRRIYGLMCMVGVLFLIAALLVKGLSYCYDESRKREFDAAVKGLIFSGVYLILLVYKISDWYGSQPTYKYSYQPFDEFVRVPMYVFIPQMFLHLASNLPSLAAILFYEFSAVYGLVTLKRMPEDDIKRFVDGMGFVKIHSVMVVGMILANVSGILVILSNLREAREHVKTELLMTMEMNWRWNCHAIDCVVGDIEGDTLEEVREAFLEKSQKEDLTEVQKKALRYIARPLWKNKKPFIRNKELAEEVPQSTKPEDAQPSTSGSAQGPQPEEPQPSTSAQDPQPEEPQPSASTQRPLRVG